MRNAAGANRELLHCVIKVVYSVQSVHLFLQTKDMEIRRFFISGCQRSGTTLMRLVLESHPMVHCFDEELGYRFLIDEACGSKTYHYTKSGISLVGFKIPRFAEQLLRKEFDDVDYGQCPSFYHSQPIVHLVRNPLDTVASMMTLKVPGGKTWVDLYGRAILSHMFKDSSTLDRFGDQYQIVVDTGLSGHKVGALYWCIKNQGLLDLLEADCPVQAVPYETFVSHPESVLRKICEFLSIPWRKELLFHSRYTHGELDEKGLAIGGTNPRRSIDVTSVGRYTKILSPEQVTDVLEIADSMSQRIERMLNI